MRKRDFSAALNKAKKRLEGIRSISKPIELGNGYSDTTYEAEIEKVEALLASYNTALSNIDGMATSLNQAEKALGVYSTSILNQVSSKFGSDSVEYEQAGGTRTSTIKRARKSSKTTKKSE
jgi:hypothetical protein